MNPSTDPRDPMPLFEHARFVRALAQQLVDPADTDDVEQDTWLAALSHPPGRPGEERGWFATVTRHVASGLRRTRLRRHERESRSTFAESTPSAADTAARAEVIQQIADAVNDLRDPYRAAILLRYYEALPPREIAKRLGAPVETVRTWIRRALEQLRAQLDASQPGGRDAWSGLLVPIAGSPPPVCTATVNTWIGALMMKTTLKAAVAIAVLALVVSVAFRDPPSPPIPLAATPVTEPQVPVDPSAPLNPEPSRSTAAAAASSVAEESTHPQTSPSRSTLRGRLLQDDEKPAVDAHFTLRGYPRSQPDLAAYRGPISWEHAEATTGEDGRFEIEFDPPPPYRFSLHHAAAGFVEMSWRWPELIAGRTYDLGDVRLERGGVLVGTAAYVDGAAITDYWTVTVAGVLPWSKDPRAGESEFSSNARASVSIGFRGRAGLREYRIESVPVGEVEIYGIRDPDTFGRQIVSIRPGEETRVDLRLSPEIHDRVNVVTRSKPIAAASPDPSHVRLIGADGEQTSKQEEYSDFNRYLFEGVPDSEHTVVIDDPRFKPARLEGIRPSLRSQVAELAGTSGIALMVFDGPDGEPVPDYGASIRLLTGAPPDSRVPDLFLLQAAGEALPTGGVYSSLVAGDYELTVRGEGRADCRVLIEGLLPGEVRPIEARLGPGATLAGAVLHADGTLPSAPVSVRLYRPALTNDGEESLYNEDTVGPLDPLRRNLHEQAPCDSKGGFRFERVPVGVYIPRAWINDDTSVALDPIHVAEGEVTEGLRLILPSASYLVGQILKPDGASWAGMHLDVGRAKEHPLPAAIDEDGRFRAGPLLPGHYQVHLVGGVVEVPTSRGSTMDTRGFAHELGRVEIAAGEDTDVLYDLRDGFPGQLAVTVVVNGEPRADLVVVVRTNNRSFATGGMTDSSGRVTLPLLPPGSYQLFARSKHMTWSTADPIPVRVTSAKTTDWTVEVSLPATELRFVDQETGEPLSNTFVFQLMHSALITTTRRLATDADGLTRIESPPGVEIEFARSDEQVWDEPSGGTVIQWTTSGPTVSEVLLKSP